MGFLFFAFAELFDENNAICISIVLLLFDMASIMRIEYKGDFSMRMKQDIRALTHEEIVSYSTHLQENEKSPATVLKYAHDLKVAATYFDGKELTKSTLIEWKNTLIDKYSTATVNSILAALNGFLKYMGWADLTVKPLKIQQPLFRDENRELTCAEYKRLVHAAENAGNRRLSLVVQTICATGIRVSELQFITVEAVHTGRTEINNKGKRRTIFLPKKLRKTLSRYLKEINKSDGVVFTTRNGKPLDRSNIWRDMKALCESAGVEPDKVFPHNLRHLFAVTYYGIEKDISRLADILGHSSINTTRIYTMESGSVHARQIERLGLIIT